MSESQNLSRAEEEDLGLQVRRCHRAFDRTLNNILAAEGFSSGAWQFLRALWKEDGANQMKLSRLNDVSAATTAIAINGMVKMGLVSRKRDRVDARKMNVLLAPRGRALKDRLTPSAARINEAASAGVPREDIRTFLRVLKQMTRNLSVGIASDLGVEDECALIEDIPPGAKQHNTGGEPWPN